jgi:crotonobetainyl-CoA:carnitine CoA-transferase CaiB-like acyl-CoA transferase
MNRGKRGIALDLTTPQGVARAKMLVAGADIVIENYAAGVMDKLGLGADALMALRPGLIMVSMGAFGATGPWSHFRAYGSTVEHASGLPHVNGRADWPPCLQFIAYGDPIAGIYGAAAALSALHGRNHQGGSWIDLSQVECLFQLGASSIIASQTEGDPPRLGSRNLHIAPRCVIATREPDDAVAVAVPDEKTWLGLCAVLGRDDWAADASLRSAAGRNARADEIEGALALWASTQTAAQAADVLQAGGVPAAPVVPTHALPDQPHLLAGDVWAFLERRYVGRHMMANAPYLVDGARLALRRPAPTVGEHTDAVLAELDA